MIYFDRKKIYFFLTVILLMQVSCKDIFSGSEDVQILKIKTFMEHRKEDRTEEAYEMLSDKSKKIFSLNEFKKYCFIYRIVDKVKVLDIGSGYYSVEYKYYDKRFKKGSNELYTFYIIDNRERFRTDDSGIVFPHTGFVFLKKNIREKDMKSAEKVIDKMLLIDPENRDVLESASKMGFIPGNF